MRLSQSERLMHLFNHNDEAEQSNFNLKYKQKIISSKPTEKTSERTEYLYPSARIRHASVFYKNKIYIWGGSILDPDSKSNPLYLYVYQIDNKRWKRFWTKTASKQLQVFSGQSHAIINNRWYLFGGVNKDQNYSSQLWRLNLDTYQWIKCEQKQESPFPSEAGLLVAFQRSWLLHYEGFNSKNSSHQHDIFLYSIESKAWHRCQGNYLMSLKFRIGTSLCWQNGKLFLFGGAYQDGEQVRYLNDFYELKIGLPNKYNKARVDIRVVSKNVNVSPRSEHFLFPIQKNYLCLLGGRNSQTFFQDLWIFNLKTQQWVKDSQFHSRLFEGNGLSCVMGGEQFFIFGGIIDKDNEKIDLMNDLWNLKVDWELLGKPDQDFDITETSFNHSCCLCYEKRNNFMFSSKSFSSATIKKFNQTIEFPFAAFGLLLDNSLIFGADQISIQIQHDTNNFFYIRIEDNGKNICEQQQFLSILMTFSGQNNSILTGCDKKIKKNILRNNSIREFGVNLKVGALRLGKRFLYISLVGDTLRVCLCQEQSLSNYENEQWQYFIHYYAYNLSTKQFANEQMRSSRQYIDLGYKRYIREYSNIQRHKNVLYIFDTVLDNKESEIHYRLDRNDVYFGRSEDIDQLEKCGYNMGYSIDVSLRAYLSSLYLKNESLSIQIYLKSNFAVIDLQHSLEHIDRLCKSGSAIELDGLVQFDFKFAQFYYLRQFRPQQRFFSNGVLLYYKNRLISRHKPNLGQMIPFLLTEHSIFPNALPFFGFAQLPQNIPLNASKTDFPFLIMLERMYSRLKFVEQSFKTRKYNFLQIEKLPYPKDIVDQSNQQQPVQKQKKISIDARDQKKIYRKRKNPAKNQEESVIKKKSKKEIYKSDFIPPGYKLRQMKKEMRSKKKQQSIPQQQQSAQVLIEHIEESSIKQLTLRNDSQYQMDQ